MDISILFLDCVDGVDALMGVSGIAVIYASLIQFLTVFLHVLLFFL